MNLYSDRYYLIFGILHKNSSWFWIKSYGGLDWGRFNLPSDFTIL